MPESFKEQMAKRTSREREMFDSLKRDLPKLEKLLEDVNNEWAGEDGVYRFYHQSFKVFYLQDYTRDMVALLKGLLPSVELNSWFLQIYAEGTDRKFDMVTTNPNWLAETRPIVEAFFHAKYFLEMGVKYGRQLQEPETVLSSGWAAFLYLYNLR